MSCSTPLPVWCEYKHHILHSFIHKEFHFKMKAVFEFDQTNEDPLLKHSVGIMVSLCTEKLRTDSRLLIRGPRLSVRGYCGGLALAGYQTTSHHHWWNRLNLKNLIYHQLKWILNYIIMHYCKIVRGSQADLRHTEASGPGNEYLPRS